MRRDGQTRLDSVQWAGLMAYANGGQLTDNPHEQGTDEWWMWRLSFLNEQEIEEYDDSLPAQAEKVIEEQPGWERRERLGVNDLVRRVHERAEALGRWLAMPMPPQVLLNAYGREPLREAVDELCAIEPEKR